ncbi:MAG: HAD family phosphatase [Anaerococcus sp.]|nr:HAD family phosphatase [Anaerococcus sp.]
MKAILFDVDGTLLASMHIWAQTTKSIFSKYNFSMNDFSHEEKGHLEALPFEEMCYFIADRVAKDMTGEEVYNHYKKTIENAYFYELESKKGVKDFLKKVKDKGIAMSIASSTDYKYLEAALKRLGIYDYFDFFATPDIVNHKKDSKEFWQYSIKKHGLDPKEITLFDDALYAIKAAKNEGIRTVGIKDFPYNQREWEEIKKIADLSLENIGDYRLD